MTVASLLLFTSDFDLVLQPFIYVKKGINSVICGKYKSLSANRFPKHSSHLNKAFRLSFKLYSGAHHNLQNI